MPDREKVIKGLYDIGGFIVGRLGFEQARNFMRTIDDTVALLKEQEAAYQGAVELLRQKTILFDDAIKRLKEQEAVEPKVSCTEQRCGNCNKVIEMDEWKTCPWCGKMIDWERWW